VEQAKSVCARCPVRAECLAYALDNGLDHGIFGGATEAERRAVRRARTPRAA
jgi:WhiB family redox-sensing transcriptional regulator